METVLGQIIGDVLEAGIKPQLIPFAQTHGLFLDTKGKRPARGKRKKVSWKDEFGNTHDLDFVLERGGTSEQVGIPVAFIESAWRRYTKHSRNKAQEIQGAILPLRFKYRGVAPFMGVILAGVFTDGAIKQLRSQGFEVLLLPYKSVVDAFAIVKINANLDETTPDATVQKEVDKWQKVSTKRRQVVAEAIVSSNKCAVDQFIGKLKSSIERTVKTIWIIPLHGHETELKSVHQAIEFVSGYDDSINVSEFVRYEIRIEFNNTDTIFGSFSGKQSALDFLELYSTNNLYPAS